jgi:hypothetical protein
MIRLLKLFKTYQIVRLYKLIIKHLIIATLLQIFNYLQRTIQ